MSHEALSHQFDHYRGFHKPPGPEEPTLDRAHEHYPDIYEKPHIYRTYHEPQVDRESMRAINAARGNPHALVAVHRAVPDASMDINPGDWVSTSRAYATGHGMHESDPSRDWPVVSMVVPAGELHSEGNSIAEWSWHPKGPS